MHGWYPGVLKYVMSLYSASHSSFLSTGKRRYGHPALTGVLPQPWLPIKKGQSLANSVDRDGSGRRGDQAVVLTLRKRYSMARRDVRDFVNKNQNAGRGDQWSGADPSGADQLSSTPATGSAPPRSHSPDNIRPLPQSQPLIHRLSFDHATGVIMLPEDGEWILQNEDSDSEEGAISRETTQHEEVVNGDEPTSTNMATGVERIGGGRYRTYYHHPERRRQTASGVISQSPPS